MVKFWIQNNTHKHEIEFLLRTWAKNARVDVQFTAEATGAIVVGKGNDQKKHLPDNFSSDFSHAKLNAHCLIENEDGKPDYLATAFYMLNSLQEYNDADPDELGRFRYTNSYQYQFKNTQENIVQQCFNEISKICGVTSPKKEKTKFFLTHDIDSVNGAILEDGFNVLKRGRIDLFLKMIFNVALQKPNWLNMDKIMSIESEYDCKSVFYWIVNQGRINKREVNADYAFHSSSIQEKFKSVINNHFENGIHKSISSDSLVDEIKKFGEQPLGNRYHYLKFHLPEMYHHMQSAEIKLDASVGFAEEIGFRNSYGLPFNPFNFKTKKPFSFVEVPLHIMDRTFYQYKKTSVKEAEKDILNFFERNKENCVLSVLWHNNFFTDYKFKGYLDLYKKILSYIKDNNFKTVNQQEIIQNYSIV